MRFVTSPLLFLLVHFCCHHQTLQSLSKIFRYVSYTKSQLRFACIMNTSSLSSNPKVNVFLNFCGEVRSAFLSHLHHALGRLNISSFMNKEEEEKKERIERKNQPPPNVIHAISEAQVALIVLSKNYASSSWCLDELVEIKKKKSITMVPVYYEVDISDVRDQRGSFGEDFHRHGQVQSPETMERWREALTKLTDTKPYFSSQTSTDDSKLTREITRHVSGLLSRSRFHKDLLPRKAGEDSSTTKKTFWGRYSPISMHRQIGLICEALELESHSGLRVIGISGVTGIGKTTIARHLYQNLSLSFQDHCFFETPWNISNQCSGTQPIGQPSTAKYVYQNSLPRVQNQKLLETSRYFHHQDCNHPACSGSQENLPSPRSLKRKSIQTLLCDLGCDDRKRTRFGSQRVLVIVDNVETIKQLERIIKDANGLGPGSRVIIVTTNKSLLLECGVEHVYEVDSLKYDAALELFSQCAFKTQYPPKPFEQLSVRAVKLTGCLPLSLKLLGSLLYEKTEEDWEGELKRFEAISELSSQGVRQDQN